MLQKLVKPLRVILPVAIVLFMLGSVLSAPAWSQGEVSTDPRRYMEREQSTGYYEQYEVKSSRMVPIVSVPGVRRGLFPYSPTGASVRIRSRLADSHQGIRFYRDLRCEYCHIRQTRNIHTIRGNLTCRQCHGAEPIAGINHYYSLMNPIRRHSYVCSKCHEGAGASFASYVIHAPNPVLLSTLKNFPMLFYVFWGMVTLAVGTFAVFLPHTIAWGIREMMMKKEKTEGEPEREK